MNTMKKIDHYAGIPICLILEVFSKVRAFFPQRKPQPPKTILLMKYFGMGSILLATPMARALRKKYPDARIGLLTLVSNRELVERLNLFDDVHLLRTDSMLHFASDALLNLLKLRRTCYDTTIDLEFFAKFSTIMTFLVGSPVRIGYFLRQIWRGDLLTHQIYYNPYKHITEVFGAMAAPLGVTVTDFTLSKPSISDADERQASEILEEHGLATGSPYIVMNVNVSDLSLERRWPAHSFQELTLGLLQHFDFRIVFIGAKADENYVSTVVEGCQSGNAIVNLAGATSLGELMAVIKRSRFFVGNDSGPLHLAAALGIPTVSFFGPETPLLYGPQGDRHLVFYEDIYCSPCLNVFNAKTAPCAGDNQCMKSITPEHVLQMIVEHFGKISAEAR
jgi:lipopolysaccharide heptosyltransferase II